MKLYILEWDNGLDYDDHEETLLGVYTSEEERNRAKARYQAAGKVWPFTTEDGKFVPWDIEANADLVPTKAADAPLVVPAPGGGE